MRPSLFEGEMCPELSTREQRKGPPVSITFSPTDLPAFMCVILEVLPAKGVLAKAIVGEESGSGICFKFTRHKSKLAKKVCFLPTKRAHAEGNS